MKLSDEKLREVVIELRPPTNLDSLRCHDGEIEDGARFFPDDENGGKTERGEENNPLELGVTDLFELKDGIKIVCMHRIDGQIPKVHAILHYPDGRLRYLDTGEVTSGVKDLSHKPVSDVCKGVAAGDYLVLQAAGTLLYAKWNRTGNRYLWLGESPAPPDRSYTLHNLPLSPYSSAIGERPLLTVDVTLDGEQARLAGEWLSGNDAVGCPDIVKRSVRDAIAEKFATFLNDVRYAGLHYARYYAVTTWMLGDGRWWNPSLRMTVGQETDIQAEIVSFLVVEGGLRLTLQLSRSPYRVEVKTGLEALQDEWSEIIRGVGLLEGDEAERVIPESISDAVWLDSGRRGFIFRCQSLDKDVDGLPKVAAVMTSHGMPSDIVGIGNRLFSIYRKGDFGEVNLLVVSDTAYPFACVGVGEIAGGRLITVEHSLRALSSGQLGDFPLYAFCSDGIRALTPVDGAFRDVQLISRDVPVVESAFAPTDDGVCFISERGVLKVEGTTITNLSARLTTKTVWSAAVGIAYIYGRDWLVIYGEADCPPLIYDFKISGWRETVFPAEGIGLDAHWYAWPYTFFAVGGRFGELEPISGVVAPRNIGEFDAIRFSTRPVKFGRPFAEKKLLYIEAVWPDSMERELAVYGANHLGIWHCLGRNPTGRMRLRGSGWRYFRFESYIKREFVMENEIKINYLKPLIICKLREK